MLLLFIAFHDFYKVILLYGRGLSLKMTCLVVKCSGYIADLLSLAGLHGLGGGVGGLGVSFKDHSVAKSVTSHPLSWLAPAPLKRGLYLDYYVARSCHPFRLAQVSGVQLFIICPQPCLILSSGTEAGRETWGMSPKVAPGQSSLPSASRHLFLEWDHLKEAHSYKVSPKALWEILINSYQHCQQTCIKRLL